MTGRTLHCLDFSMAVWIVVSKKGGLDRGTNPFKAAWRDSTIFVWPAISNLINLEMFESLIWFGKLIGRFISRVFSNSPQLLQRFSAEILFGCAGGSAHTFCDILSGVVVKDSHRYWLPVYTFGLWSSSMCPDQFWKLVQWATRHTFNCALHIPISREELSIHWASILKKTMKAYICYGAQAACTPIYFCWLNPCISSLLTHP